VTRRAPGAAALALLLAAACGEGAAGPAAHDVEALRAELAAVTTVPPVVPGAAGYGMGTKAGRRGQVLRVTHLGASGPGSLRAALETAGPRTVIFDVGGTIALTENLVVREPYLTVAGQTAPSPGITLAGAGVVIETGDVLLQHLRVRVGAGAAGPAPEERDGIRIGAGAYRVVVDHASVAWAVDEGASTSGAGVRDVTFRACIFAEGLSRSIHPKGEHSRGFLVHTGSARIALLDNLFAHNHTRSPGVNGNTSVLVANNLVYDPGYWGAGFWDVREAPTGPTAAVVAGNHFIPGPSSAALRAPITLWATLSPGGAIWLADNRVTPARPVLWVQPGTPAVLAGRPGPTGGVRIRPSAEVEGPVLDGAGARPADRDAVDRRVVAQVRARGGRIIDAPDPAEWPAAGAPVVRRLPLPPRHNADDDQDGYTNLEEWLHALAAALERPAPSGQAKT
jgi:hypothetical protein